ncbi:MAG: stalk domain-containing protein [Lachnospirales bacterium]
MNNSYFVKKTLTMTVVVLALTIVFSANIVIEILASNITVSVNGELVDFDQQPVIINGRTLVPIRFVAEDLGYTVRWDEKNRNIYMNNNEIIPTEYDNHSNNIGVYVNDSEVAFENQEPVIINDRTLIPLKDVAEDMNATVTWEDDLKRVIIISNSLEDANLGFYNYELIDVYGGDLNGERQSNSVVDIGYGDRIYYGFTNEYGQLIRVTADNIVLQDDDTEPVLSSGRYYSDEAKVPGVESKTLDEGHVIADSLGGVSNAYNITPQNSTINRTGEQADMERDIRTSGGCENFISVITYPNTQTQIPSHYSYLYVLDGNLVNNEFDNIILN